MNYILLDVGMPVASWLGIVTVGIMGILAYAIQKVVKNVEDDVVDVKAENKDIKLELRKMDDKINAVEKQSEKSISDMNLNIIDKLETIKDKFYDLRK